ncbi:uncharacterized protein [Aphelocoma coerulescens]|uniref:uncharacterized protein n=1 Tax=Aphelocoma coerulescens TaxID=39617 RepID=UPI0036051CC6
MEKEPPSSFPVPPHTSTPSPNPSLGGSQGATRVTQGSRSGASLPGSSRTPQSPGLGRQGPPAKTSILKPSAPVPSPKVVRFDIPSSDPSTPDSTCSPCPSLCPSRSPQSSRVSPYPSPRPSRCSRTVLSSPYPSPSPSLLFLPNPQNGSREAQDGGDHVVGPPSCTSSPHNPFPPNSSSSFLPPELPPCPSPHPFSQDPEPLPPPSWDILHNWSAFSGVDTGPVPVPSHFSADPAYPLLVSTLQYPVPMPSEPDVMDLGPGTWNWGRSTMPHLLPMVG